MKYMVEFIKYRWNRYLFGYIPSRGFAQFLLLSRLIWDAWLMYEVILLKLCGLFSGL